MSRVLVVDDKQMMRDSVATTLRRAGFRPVAAESGERAMDLIGEHRPAAVVTDLKMPGMDGIELLSRTLQIDPNLPVILMTAYATVDTAVDALKRGAFDYIQKPFEGDELVAAVKRAAGHCELARENEALRHAESPPAGHDLVGDSGPMQAVRRQIDRIAPSHGTVLLTGESGTGKEVVAHSIHAASPRAAKPLLCVNCAALSPNLLESELFGHEKGAFTGADQMRRGRFELADGGTLLLDEISEIEPRIQAKLLRVLQEGQFERVGASTSLQVDVRIIATTNRDLRQAVADGAFRQDLFYRLNVLPIHLPALRDRPEDVPPLADHFLQQAAQRDGRPAQRFDEAAAELLRGYRWPGNVRELQNICERAAVLTTGTTITAETIRPWLGPEAGAAGTAPDEGEATGRPGPQITIPDADKGQTLEQIERQVILRTLESHGGHRQRTAEALGIGVRTLGLKLKKWKERNLVANSL